MHTDMCTHIDTRLYIHTLTRTYVYRLTYIYPYTCIHVCVHMMKDMCMCIHSHTHTYYIIYLFHKSPCLIIIMPLGYA